MNPLNNHEVELTIGFSVLLTFLLFRPRMSGATQAMFLLTLLLFATGGVSGVLAAYALYLGLYGIPSRVCNLCPRPAYSLGRAYRSLCRRIGSSG